MIGDARDYLAGVLTGLGIPVHAYPPQSIAVPAAAIVPGYPYIVGQYLQPAMEIGLSVQIVTALHAARQLDDLIYTAALILADAGHPPEDITPPTIDLDTGTLTARIPVTLTWKG